MSDAVQEIRGIPELAKLSDVEVDNLYQCFERAWLRANYVHGTSPIAREIAFVNVDVCDQMRMRDLLPEE